MLNSKYSPLAHPFGIELIRKNTPQARLSASID